MKTRAISRRAFIHTTSLAASGAALGAGPARTAEETPSSALHLATNQYPWLTFYRREGRDLSALLDVAVAEIASAGLQGFEPLGDKPQDVDALVPLLRKHRLEMRSIYVNSTLHTEDAAASSIERVLAVAGRAKLAGVRIIVTNPNPIRWGGPEDKDDAQLRTQARALGTLGERLASLGLTLAYHNHDAELRNAAREFHHMMVGTDPRFVTLCLDAHWIYRGSGNSAVAVSDIVRLYGPRISELHLRQSIKGTWTEAFGEGDIDYAAIAEHLHRIGIKPHLVLEQAVEEGTPRTMDAGAAHRMGAEYARRLFRAFAG